MAIQPNLTQPIDIRLHYCLDAVNHACQYQIIKLYLTVNQNPTCTTGVVYFVDAISSPDQCCSMYHAYVSPGLTLNDKKVRTSIAEAHLPCRESTTTGGGVNYQLLATAEVAQRTTPSCSRPQPATNNGVRHDRKKLTSRYYTTSMQMCATS